MNQSRRPRVAIAGIRGVPFDFSGSETAVEEIGPRLVRDGFEVSVYCRRHADWSGAPEYRGMRRIVLPSIPTFHLDTVSHSFLVALHVLLRNAADVVHFHGMGNALVLPLFWFSRKKVVVTIDGPDWERPKWGRLARFALKLSARIATRWADALIIDNHPSIAYFREHFDVEGTYIAYGADLKRPDTTDYIESLGLRPGPMSSLWVPWCPTRAPTS